MNFPCIQNSKLIYLPIPNLIKVLPFFFSFHSFIKSVYPLNQFNILPHFNHRYRLLKNLPFLSLFSIHFRLSLLFLYIPFLLIYSFYFCSVFSVFTPLISRRSSISILHFLSILLLSSFHGHTAREACLWKWTPPCINSPPHRDAHRAHHPIPRRERQTATRLLSSLWPSTTGHGLAPRAAPSAVGLADAAGVLGATIGNQ